MTAPIPEGDLSALNDAAQQLLPEDPTALGSTYGRTDWDNGRRLALYEGLDLRYCNDFDIWYRWDNTHWQTASQSDMIGAAARTALQIPHEAMHIEDEDDRGRHLAHGTSSLSERALKATISLARAIPDVRTSAQTFKRHSEWINVPNPWTFSPRTLDGHHPRRDDMLTKMCATPWVPDAHSTTLDRFFDRFLPDKEERAYILQLIAVSALFDGNAARHIVLLLGPTSTGKSTLTELITSTLGPDYASSANASVFRGNLDDKPRPDILRVNGTHIMFANEASEHWELHPDQIKRMTGGDRIVARGMRSDIMQETTASYTPFLIANTVPRIHGSDNALRRRMLCCLMDTAVSESDDDVEARMRIVRDEEARRALLALLIRTYHECEGRLQLPPPLRFMEATLEMFAALDDVDEVLTALREEGSIYPAPEGTPTYHLVTSTMLHTCYIAWINRHGTPQMKRNPLGRGEFRKRIESLGYELKTSNGSRVMGWCLGSTSTTNFARF